MKHFLIISLVALLAACSSTPKRDLPPPSIKRASTAIPLQQPDKVIAALQTQYQQWQGVPYQWGGLTHKGVDCSGFVHITYLQALGQNVPRSTQLQMQQGTKVKASELSAGDLVFFKTSAKDRHVGIYLENKEFLHASTSQGVTVSRLDNPYWQSAYLFAKRP